MFNCPNNFPEKYTFFTLNTFFELLRSGYRIILAWESTNNHIYSIIFHIIKVRIWDFHNISITVLSIRVTILTYFKCILWFSTWFKLISISSFIKIIASKLISTVKTNNESTNTIKHRKNFKFVSHNYLQKFIYILFYSECLFTSMKLL